MLLRLKPRLGVLTAQAAHAVADAAVRLGNGKLALTNRANLQLRGFTAESASAFAAIAVDLGLAHPNPAAELRRNVLVSPLIGLDPALDPATFDIARMLDDMLARRDELAPLPGKFGLVVDGGGALPVDGAPYDVLLQPHGGSVTISLDGSTRSADVALAELRRFLLQLLRAFIADGPHRRMCDADAATIFTNAGLACNTQRLARQARSPIGKVPGGFGIGVRYGMFDAAQLHRLADLATQHGDGTLRLTPWRALIVPGVQDVARHADRITDPTDPSLRIEVCPGAPSCVSATVDTLAAADELAAHADWSGTLHVSGCAKGCAHPGPTALTLVGEDGQWNIIRDGNASAPPLLRGCTIGSIIEMAQRP